MTLQNSDFGKYRPFHIRLTLGKQEIVEYVIDLNNTVPIHTTPKINDANVFDYTGFDPEHIRKRLNLRPETVIEQIDIPMTYTIDEMSEI